MDKVKIFLHDAVRRVDPILLLCTTLLSVISLVTVYGAVDNFGMSKLKMQFAMAAAGFLITFIVANLDYHIILDRLWVVMLVGSVALLGLTLVAGDTGATSETANRSWLTIPGIGIAIQPSEFVKITFICSFSKHLSLVQGQLGRLRSLLGLGVHAMLVVGLILLSGDLGVALVYLAMIIIMLFCAGLHPAYFIGAAVLVVILSPFLWNSLAHYQQMRILVGFNPELDPVHYGWQPLLSRNAIAAGGFFGKGISGGSIYEVLTASHTDFIFATVCEKLGFFGGSLIIMIFMVMVVRIFMIARSAFRSDCGGLVCVGIGAMLIVQVLENVGMCLAMLPVVGITLPFLSCGGSSMLATFMMFGLLHNVHAHSQGVRDSSTGDTLDINISLLR